MKFWKAQVVLCKILHPFMKRGEWTVLFILRPGLPIGGIRYILSSYYSIMFSFWLFHFNLRNHLPTKQVIWLVHLVLWYLDLHKLCACWCSSHRTFQFLSTFTYMYCAIQKFFYFPEINFLIHFDGSCFFSFMNGINRLDIHRGKDYCIKLLMSTSKIKITSVN